MKDLLSILSDGEFSVFFWATIGGFIVFLGLAIEKFADWMNDRFLGGSDKPHKTLELSGWCILMFGILIEIAVGGWAANDAWQTRQMAINNDPFNQPVSDVSAFVEFEVNRTYSSDLTGNRIPKVYDGSIALMALCSTNTVFYGGGIGVNETIKAPQFLVANAYSRVPDTWSKDRKTYVEFTYLIHFSLSDLYKVEFSHARIPSYKALDTFSETKYVALFIEFLPYEAEVREGTVDLVINGTIHKSFYIVPYKNSTATQKFTDVVTTIYATDFPTNKFVPPENK